MSTLSTPRPAPVATDAVVELRKVGDALEASVRHDAPADTVYAFYLYCAGERVAKRWYEADASARFAGPLPAGTYATLAFWRGPQGEAPTRQRSQAVVIAADDAIAGVAAPPKEPSQKLPPPITAPSLQALGRLIRPREIQRIDIPIGPLTYNLLTAPKRGRRLYVLLRGAEGDRGRVPLPRFSRFSWRDAFGDTVVCIADPTLQLDADLRLGWYFGSREHDAIEQLAHIVVALCGVYRIAIEDVYAYGSSGGGFAALQLARRLGRGATAIAINPQTDVLEYPLKRSVDAFTTVAFGSRDHAAARRGFAARLSVRESWFQPPAGEARCLFVQNSVDRDHYRGHFRPFADLMGIPDNGSSADGRMGSIVYNHPSGHAAEPQEMLPRILQAAQALRWKAGTPPPARPPAAPATQAAPRRPAAIAAAPAPKAPAARPAPLAAAPTHGRRRVQVDPLSPTPTSDGGPIALAQLYLPLTATRRGTKAGTIAYKPRSDVAAVELALPLDWTIDPFKDRNWNAQLHMWRLADFELFDAERGGEWAKLRAFTRVMLDWHRFHLVEGRPSIYAWQDMMVGIRAMKLAYVISHWQHGHVKFNAATVAKLHDLVETHLGFLLDPAEVRYSNHTLSDLHGALALARVLDPAARAAIEDFAAEVFPKVLDGQFDADGVHREHSFGYHRYGINYLKRLIATGWFDRFGLRELVAKAEAVLPWFHLPDGRMAAIGDTDGSAPPAGVTQTAFSGSNELFNRAGYVIVRDDGGGAVDKAEYLCFMGAYNSKFHKQADDLSLIWFHGEDILCDAGKYAYKTDEINAYVLSRRAHNTVEIDRPERMQLTGTTPYGSAIEGVEPFPWGRLIRAAVRFEQLRVTHRRYCLHSLDGWLLVIDVLDGAATHDYVQWSHFAPRISGFEQRGNDVDARLPSGRSLAIRSAGSRKPSLELVHGAPPPRRQGWISQAYRRVEPNMALGIRQRGADALFATLYAVEMPHASVERARDGSLLLRAGAGTTPDLRLTIELQGDDITIRQAG